MALSSILLVVVIIAVLVGLFFLYKIVTKLIRIIMTIVLVGLIIAAGIGAYSSATSFSDAHRLFLFTENNTTLVAFEKMDDNSSALLDIPSSTSAYEYIITVTPQALAHLTEVQFGGEGRTYKEMLEVIKGEDKRRASLAFIETYDTANKGLWIIRQMKKSTIAVQPSPFAFRLGTWMPDFVLGSD
ncbi:hypothetical protein GF342_03820 [Candidatus Woesearchaeota archaeon]|nr:hypothetical protein [Candidatus Woesearchaeota archaeon]